MKPLALFACVATCLLCASVPHFSHADSHVAPIAGPTVGSSARADGMLAVDKAVRAATNVRGAAMGYSKGFFITSADEQFKLVMKGRVQSRFNFSVVDVKESNAFSVPRARLTLKGHVFSKRIKYKFQTDFSKGSTALKDFFVDWALGESDIVIRTGQYKRPFMRHQISSTSRFELIDRAITDKEFNGGRDIGVTIHNNYSKSPALEWAVGIFNGTGDKATVDVEQDPVTGEVDIGERSNVPDQVQPALVARIGINRGGIDGYAEPDFKGGSLRWAVGGGFLAQFDNDGDNQSSIDAQVDAIAKVNGTSAQAGVYVSFAQDGNSFSDQSYDAFGVHLQVGHMLTRMLQPSARYAVVVPEDNSADTRHEILGGFSVYEFGHGVKWQIDVGVLIEAATKFVTRTQMQLSF